MSLPDEGGGKAEGGSPGIWTCEGWLYLACVLDTYSRKIVGWSMNERMTKDLVLDALRMALGRRQVV